MQVKQALTQRKDNLYIAEGIKVHQGITYPRATGLWILVLTKSSGWKIIVEHVPLREPARNDFTTGDWNEKALNL